MEEEKKIIKECVTPEANDCISYGVDINQEVTPIAIRDTIVSCFADAHAKELEHLREFGEMSEDEFAEMKKMNVEMLIKKSFVDTGGDFENPTKDSIEKAINVLAAYASNFRNQEIVQKNYHKVMCLVRALK
ncbi:MAG: hypothetical protein HGA36_02015 [Candidatus Moranbacteria bacterium]|nr:hypothetical protein [Candidatus Moranbacteria bacterium]